MAKNTKKVNVYPRTPIVTLNPIIRTNTLNVTMTYDQIRKCIMGRALVDEILNDGSTIRLTLENYNISSTEESTPSVEEAEQPVVDGADPVSKESDEPDAVTEEVSTNKNFTYNKKNKNKVKRYQNSVQAVPSGHKAEETTEIEEKEEDVAPTADETTEEVVEVMDAENLNV